MMAKQLLKRMMAKPLSTANLISQNTAFGASAARSRCWMWENADDRSQRNSASQSCSARLGLIWLAIRKIGGGSDFENIDAIAKARWSGISTAIDSTLD